MQIVYFPRKPRRWAQKLPHNKTTEIGASVAMIAAANAIPMAADALR
jgi:hypothetical protein